MARMKNVIPGVWYEISLVKNTYFSEGDRVDLMLKGYNAGTDAFDHKVKRGVRIKRQYDLTSSPDPRLWFDGIGEDHSRPVAFAVILEGDKKSVIHDQLIEKHEHVPVPVFKSRFEDDVS